MEECYFTKSNTPPWVISRFSNCIKGTKSRETSHMYFVNVNAYTSWRAAKFDKNLKYFSAF